MEEQQARAAAASDGGDIEAHRAPLSRICDSVALLVTDVISCFASFCVREEGSAFLPRHSPRGEASARALLAPHWLSRIRIVVSGSRWASMQRNITLVGEKESVECRAE